MERLLISQGKATGTTDKQPQISRPHRLQIEEEGEKLSGDPGCLSGKHQQGNGGNAQTHQGQVIV